MAWLELFQGFQILTSTPSIIPKQPGKCGFIDASLRRSISLDQYISCANATLMHEAMNIASSHKLDRSTFHWKDSYATTLSCFKCTMKLSKHCSGVNFVGPPFVTLGIPMLCAFPRIVGHTKETNMSHSQISKFVKALNNKGTLRM